MLAVAPEDVGLGYGDYGPKEVTHLTWDRARGWALFLGIVGYPYYRDTNPIFAGIAKRALDQVVAEAISS